MCRPGFYNKKCNVWYKKFTTDINEFEKGKNQNRLSDNNIEKIISTYRERKDVPKYAHLASIEEIRQNDYNLNIPRYVDTSEEEKEIDINEVRNLLTQDKKEY